MHYKVLVVDDDVKLQKLLRTYLEEYDIEVVSLMDGNNVIETVDAEKPDIVILDIIMPGKNGFEVLKEIRHSYATPVIMLSAKGEDTDKIIGLELGADDYMPKPYNPRELMARINAVLRRAEVPIQSNESSERFIKVNDLTLDRSRQLLQFGTKDTQLSTMEHLVLEALMSNPDSVLSRDQLMSHAKGQDAVAFDRSIDMHISKLRSKIENLTGQRERIRTVWGTGYMFVSEL